MQTDAAFASLQTAETLTPSQIEERARGLRDELSLDEKISLMHGQLPLLAGRIMQIKGGGTGDRVAMRDRRIDREAAFDKPASQARRGFSRVIRPARPPRVAGREIDNSAQQQIGRAHV